ncbi:hypothetical protein HPNQ4216_0097 [Helicobacter pylori NQ4216]|nr:hypothetical protein HPNQ4216_0097 [Helicobacter pylori NQ4216]
MIALSIKPTPIGTAFFKVSFLPAQSSMKILFSHPLAYYKASIIDKPLKETP